MGKERDRRQGVVGSREWRRDVRRLREGGEKMECMIIPFISTT
jgi:hypothetical protein